MSVDFKSLLSTPADSIEKPKPLPGGTYNGIVTKYEFGESKEKKTPFVRYTITVQSAGEDVDPDALVGVDLSKKSLRKDFYLTADSQYRAKDFIESLGVSVSGRSLGEILPEAVNQHVLVEVTQRSSPDGSEIFNDVGALKGVA